MCVIHEIEFVKDYRFAVENGYTEYEIEGIWYPDPSDPDSKEEWYHVASGTIEGMSESEFVEMCVSANMPYDEIFVGWYAN
jgi:hypothetical protein